MPKLVRNSTIISLITILLCYWQSAFAVNVDSLLNIFNPKAVTDGTDKSILLLGQMFGGVDGVLHGYGTQVFGVMFGIFNSAILGIGGIFILYTIIVSTLNTAQEGEYMGKRWNSKWIPIRSGVGASLLLPGASGYSVIQIFMMWVVLQGIAGADTLWKTAIDYILSSGTIMPTSITSTNLSGVVGKSTSILKRNICLAGVSFFLEKEKGINIQLQASYPKLGADGSTYYIYFPSREQIKELKAKGVDLASIKNAPKGGFVCGIASFAKQNDQILNEAQISASWQVVLDSEPYANALISNINSMINQNGIIDQGETSNVIRNASLDYIAILDPAIHRTNSIVDSNINQSLQNAITNGWILAGEYYQNLSGLNRQRASVAKMTMDLQPIALTNYGDEVFSKSIWLAINNVMLDITGSIETSALSETGGSPVTNLPVNLNFPRASGAGPVDTVINMFTLGLVSAAEDYWGSGFLHSNVDPIIAVVYLGNKLIDRVAWMWIEIAGIIFAITFVTSIFRFTSAIMDAIKATLLWIIPLTAMMMGLLFTAGIALAYYVPLIPYIIFLFGALGWIIGVIETMIAAPLVAMGIMHPEGHDVYGKIEPAIMLIVNIFLKPSLMIIGFIVAILLSYVGLKLLNLGFGPAVASMSTAGSNGWSDGFKSLVIVLIYTYLVVMIINKAHTLIVEIPNKVTRWLGGGEQQLGDSQAPLREIQGAVTGAGGKLGQQMASLSQETAKGAMDAGDILGKKTKEWWKNAKQGPKKGLSIDGVDEEGTNLHDTEEDDTDDQDDSEE